MESFLNFSESVNLFYLIINVCAAAHDVYIADVASYDQTDIDNAGMWVKEIWRKGVKCILEDILMYSKFCAE